MKTTVFSFQEMYLPRFLEPRLRRLAEHFPVVVVTGPRQVGKSTLLQHVFGQEAEQVVFDPISDIGNARRDPELFLRSRGFEPGGTPRTQRLILDEI